MICESRHFKKIFVSLKINYRKQCIWLSWYLVIVSILKYCTVSLFGVA